MLESISDNVTTIENRIKEELAEYKDRFSVSYYPVIDSTNTEAKRLILSENADMRIIVAGEQTNGRGRRGRSFYSPDHTGIYMTLLVPTYLPIENILSVTTAASVAVEAGIKKVTGIQTGIKWVNDIYLNDKKIAGILCETVTNHQERKFVIIGIGINVSTDNFPDDISAIAGNLTNESLDHCILISQIAKSIIYFFDNPDDTSYLKEYKENSIVLGKKVIYEQNGIKFDAIAIDIDEKGGLIVQQPDGTCITLSTGEITLRLKN